MSKNEQTQLIQIASIIGAIIGAIIQLVIKNR